MLYILSLLFIIVKGIAFVIKNEILFYLTEKNLIFFIILICTIILCKKALRYSRIFLNIEEHIIQYRFKSKEDFRYSAIILSTAMISYLSSISYLRFRTFNKPIDLKIIYTTINDLYIALPQGIFLYNIIIFLFLIYLFILLVKLIKKRLNIHITKMHFYLMSFKKYLRLHYYFRDHVSVDACFIDKISRYYNLCLDYIFCLYLFGYYKETLYRYSDEKNLPARTRRYLWTVEEKKRYKVVFNRYHYLVNAIYKPTKFLFYQLHFFALIFCVVSDIKYHNYNLISIAKIMPLLFMYQIYIFLSQFVSDKIVFNVSAEINTLYYKDVQHLNDKLMFINGELFESPNYKEIIMEFLEYEAADFYWTRMKH